jgi:hypothetical protein
VVVVRVRKKRIVRTSDGREVDTYGPYVCPGCHAVGEACAPDCIDAEIERSMRGDDDEASEYVYDPYTWPEEDEGGAW